MAKVTGYKTISIILILMLLTTSVCYANVNSSSTNSVDNLSIPKQNGKTQEYIVEMDDNATERLNSKADKADVISSEQTEELKDNNCLVLELSENQKDKIENLKETQNIEPNVEMEANKVIPINEAKADAKNEKNNSKIDRWNLKTIGADKNYKNRGTGVKVAVLDSGISYSDDLNIAGRANMIEEDLEEEGEPLFDDPSGHGTSIASIIAAQRDSSNVRGIADKADVYSIKVLDNENKAPLSRILEGIYLAIDNDMDVINMSFGMSKKSDALETAIKKANKKGIIMVAASGNQGGNIEYPANYENVISVGSVNSKGKISSFSSGGSNVDILAPGEKVWANSFLNGYMPLDGTSISTAHVTGAAVIAKELIPKLNTANFKKLLTYSSNKAVKSNTGIVNIKNIIKAIEVKKWDTKTTKDTRKEIPATDTSDTSDIVTGSWLSVDHRESVTSTNVETAELFTIASMVQRVDKYYPVTASEYSRMRCGALHGQHNYVANLHFLYYMARYAKLYNTYNFLKAADIEKFYKEKGSKIKHIKDNKSGEKDYNNLKNAVKDVLTGAAKENGKPIRDVVNARKRLKGNKLAAAIIMGYSAHLLGDIFAHRTMVPKAVADRTSGKNTINFKSFSKGMTLKNRIKAYVIETRDIDSYEHKIIKSKRLYEDNITTFYPSRYSYTCKLMKRMLDLFSGKKGKAFNVNIILTTEDPSDFVLYVNNMYPYAQSAKCESDKLKQYSTTKFRVDYPNGPTGKFYENEEDAVDYDSYIYKEEK